MRSRELNDNAPLAVRLRHWGNHGAQSVPEESTVDHQFRSLLVLTETDPPPFPKDLR